VFNCDTCAFRQAIDGLDPDNLFAWHTMNALATRFAVDTHSAALLLDRLTQQMDGEEFADLMTRLAII